MKLAKAAGAFFPELLEVNSVLQACTAVAASALDKAVELPFVQLGTPDQGPLP